MRADFTGKRRTMYTLLSKQRILLFGAALFLGIAAFIATVNPVHAQRKMERKECLDCHKSFADKYLGMKNVHSVVKEKKCEECHIRHGRVPKLLLKKAGNELCFDCHNKEKIGMSKAKIHTALRKGKCISCHDPHASQASKLLKAEGAAVCTQCHAKEKFEKKVVHKIVKSDGCKACHFSHSSDQNNLLTKADPALCLDCHSSGASSFKKAHGSYPVDSRPCSGCHDPHSSSLPKLLKTSVHNPVASSSCDSCHGPATGQKPFEVTQSGAGLCTMCHDQEALKAGGSIEHVPFQGGMCLSCHDPHASDQPRLLLQAGNQLCFSCHNDKAAKTLVIQARLPTGRDVCPATHLMPRKTSDSSLHRKASSAFPVMPR
jgi:predicted CXXCH cytochrome family protein